MARAQAAALASLALAFLIAGAVGWLSLPAVGALLLAGVGVVFVWAGSGKRGLAVFALAAVAVCAISLARGVAAREGYDEMLASVPFGKEVELSGVVASLPAQTARSTQVVLGSVRAGGQPLPNDARVRLITHPWASFRPGDRVVLRGVIEPPFPFVSERTGAVVDLSRRDAAHHIVGIVRFGNIVAQEPAQTPAALRWNATLRDRLGSILPEPLAALASGMLLGGRDALGKELEEAFTRSGLIHLVVLSGYNIAIVAGVLLLAARHLPRALAVLLVVAGVGGVVVFAGAEAPAVRAGVMGSIAALGLIVGRRADALAALVLSAVLVGFVNPLALAYDISLHLSLAATAGVLIFGDLFAVSFRALVPFEPIALVLGSTLAAQLAVAPLLWHIAGALSIAALPANALVVPFVPVVMALTAAALAASAASASLATVIALPLKAILLWIVKVGTLFSALPMGTLTLPPLSLAGALVIYGGVGLGFALWRYAGRHASALRAMVSQFSAAQYASK
ncbi:MAG: hypothetical protein KatS3mg099_158 [Candidatus Parcubacteria bacterium]|nr:MAG: hypothetical protein KatS3mg099_158 [Candidatus Parcubacteria bacterium]